MSSGLIPADPHPYVGCGAYHGGCGCLGLWDCAHDNRLERVEAVLRVARAGQDDDAIREIALAVLRAVFPENRLAFDEERS